MPTTIVFMKYEGGIVCGADRKVSTSEPLLSDTCKLFHARLAPNLIVGISGDELHCKHVIDIMDHILEEKLNGMAGVDVDFGVKTIEGIISTSIRAWYEIYQSSFRGYFVVGGLDKTGSHVYKFDYASEKFVENDEFVVIGSGGKFALPYLQQHKGGCNREDVINTVLGALEEAATNDPKTGKTHDIICLTHEKITTMDRLQRHYAAEEGCSFDFITVEL